MTITSRHRRRQAYASEIWLPGAAGNYLNTPDSAAISIVGDIDVRVKLNLANWALGTSRILITKSRVDGQSAYDMFLNAANQIQFRWWPTGLNAGLINKASSVATGSVNGVPKWLRATLDVDNLAAGNDVKFWTSDDNITYTQLGTTATTAGVTSIFDGTDPLQLGGNIDGSANLLQGILLRAQIYNGIGGVLVMDLDPTLGRIGQAGFKSNTGEIWTLNRAGVDPIRLR